MSKYTVLKYYMDTLRNIEDFMDIRETSNYQLDIFKSNIPGFIGCYPSNKIPRMKKMNSFVLLIRMIIKNQGNIGREE